MRAINWDKPLSREDVTWLRSSGMYSVEERIRANGEQFNKEYADAEAGTDEATQSALDPTSRTGQLADNAVTPVDPTEEPPADDDYESWKVQELEDEVKARNDLADTTEVTVVGTGTNGNTTKPDLIKGLRLWDQENPNALS